MTSVSALQAPDLPDLEDVSLAADTRAIDLSGALVAGAGATVRAEQVRVRESELRGLTLEPGNVPGLTLADVIVRECAISNVDGREGRLTRVEVYRSQLVGFGLQRGDVRDLRVVDSSLQLASFASATLRNVVFERVNLTEASFMHARLESVAFVDCRLEGTDFRHAKLAGCAVRGTSLDGVLGVESMRGLRMPWPDVLGSAAALAAALGIDVEPG
ncbi:MAG: pentapeptide repeat-containing protein [Solirubrobacteraceae bacterium]